MSIELAMQLIKGGFSYRLKKETGYLGEVWQKGFSEVRILDERSLAQHRAYILENPVKAGLVITPDEYPLLLCIFGAHEAGTGAKARRFPR